MDPALQAAHSSAVEPNPGLTSRDACDSGPPDSYPVVGSSPRAPKPAEPGWALVVEFTAADIFQYSPFGTAELIKVSLFVRRLSVELCPARVGS